MTLAEVAASLREVQRISPTGNVLVRDVIDLLERDPDFTLRDRVEALAKEWREKAFVAEVEGVDVAQPIYAWFTERLREVVEGKS